MTTSTFRIAGSLPSVGDVVEMLNVQYPPWMAEEWDAVGLICGRNQAPVRKVLFAVDPHPAVAAEAIEWGADLVVVHHPLYLTPVHDVATGWQGDLVHDLISAGIGLFAAHTNADVAEGGVSDALAAVFGLTDVSVLASEEAAARGLPEGTGLGRVGWLPAPTSLAALVEVVSHALPASAGGIRVAGDLAASVQSVAVCGGAGDSLIGQARRVGADAYVTADLRHHRAFDAGCDGGPALIDAGHWSTEWPWLPIAASRLVNVAEQRGTTVETRVSTVVTDPWSRHQAFE